MILYVLRYLVTIRIVNAKNAKIKSVSNVVNYPISTGLTTSSPETNVRHSRKDIIIKPADKGSGVVVMDHQQYIDEAMCQLTNRTNHERRFKKHWMTCETTITFLRRLINFSLPQIVEQPDSTFWLRFTNPATQEDPSYLTIVLPLNIISLFVDSFLKPLVPRISSYIHDNPDFPSQQSPRFRQPYLLPPLCTNFSCFWSCESSAYSRPLNNPLMTRVVLVIYDGHTHSLFFFCLTMPLRET